MNPGPTTERERRWYRLDNAARIFPPIAGRTTTTVYRLSATLVRTISLAVLQEAASRLARRFPYLRVNLRRGVFWYYLEETAGPFPVHADLTVPCSRYPRVRRDPELLHIYARGRKISVEVSHTLSDGMAAKRFFRVLLVEYLLLRETLPEPDDPAIRAIEQPDVPTREAETEFAFRKHYAPDLPFPPRYPRAWHARDRRLPANRYRVTTLIYPLSWVKACASRFGVNVTEFLAAVFLFALQASARRTRGSRRPLRLLIPVDLRGYEGSQTMRNFFTFLMIELDIRLGTYELPEIAFKVHHQLRAEMDIRSLRRHVTRNVRPERNPVIRLLPVWIKDVILRIAHRKSGDSANSASFSNLMALDLPNSFEKHIDHVDLVPMPSVTTGINATLFSVHDRISLTFGSKLSDHCIERDVARTLASEGVTGRIVTNWG